MSLSLALVSQSETVSHKLLLTNMSREEVRDSEGLGVRGSREHLGNAMSRKCILFLLRFSHVIHAWAIYQLQTPTTVRWNRSVFHYCCCFVSCVSPYTTAQGSRGGWGWRFNSNLSLPPHQRQTEFGVFCPSTNHVTPGRKHCVRYTLAKLLKV